MAKWEIRRNITVIDTFGGYMKIESQTFELKDYFTDDAALSKFERGEAYVKALEKHLKKHGFDTTFKPIERMDMIAEFIKNRC
jgi:hypothetical protein